MSEKFMAELEAMKTIFTCLEPLDDDVRKNVLSYVLKRLSINPSDILPESKQNKADTPDNITADRGGKPASETHMLLQDFMALKKPKSAIEMTALIAYYLLYVAEPENQHKVIKAADLETQFKISGFNPYPNTPMKNLLANTKNAGYIDAGAGATGEYKLNAVGYNLVKHNLPRKDKK